MLDKYKPYYKRVVLEFHKEKDADVLAYLNKGKLKPTVCKLVRERIECEEMESTIGDRSQFEKDLIERLKKDIDIIKRVAVDRKKNKR